MDPEKLVVLVTEPLRSWPCVVLQVALPHEIQEVPDSSLAPALGPGAQVVFISAVGEHPQTASIIAMQTDAW